MGFFKMSDQAGRISVKNIRGFPIFCGWLLFPLLIDLFFPVP